MKWFYMARNDVSRHGVADETKLAEMAKSRQLDPEDLLWNCESGTRWVAASSLPGLFAGPEAVSSARGPAAASGRTAPTPPRSIRKTSWVGLWMVTAAALLLVLLVLAWWLFW